MRGQAALGATHSMLADHLGSSKRTVERWAAGRSHPSDTQVLELARLVHPRDPALAARIAASKGETLVGIGVVAPPPLRAGPSLAHLIDAVVCVAAETLDVPSRSLRPALHAAFKRARELGMSLEDAEKALTPAEAARK